MKNRFKIIILMVVILLTTGCGKSKYITDKNNEIVQYKETGQLLQKDILCLPEKDGELYNLYKKYGKELDFKFSSIPSCENFKINSNESKGLWELLFVKPLAWLILKLGKIVNNLGLSLILIGLVIRLLLLPFTLKSTKQTMNMRKAQPEMERLERKYKDRTDQESMMAKSQEMMMIYSKYKVNPMMGCLLSLIQLPLFFAFLQAIYRVPAIYEETMLGFNLGMSPLKGLQNGNYFYILIMILIVVSTYFSFKQTMAQTPQGNEEAAKQMKIMIYVMLFVITYASLTLPTALAFYWIITYVFIAVQNYFTDISMNGRKKKKKSGKNLLKEGSKHGKNR